MADPIYKNMIANVMSPSTCDYHVFVDLENVHEVDSIALGDPTVAFTVLAGPQQRKLRVELVRDLLSHPGSVRLIHVERQGPNALEFALTYYLGQAVISNPTCRFCIVTKDTDYDPLLSHIRSQGVRAHRHASFTTLPFSKGKKSNDAAQTAPGPIRTGSSVAVYASNISAWSKKAHENLTAHPNGRPNSRAKLLNHIRTVLGSTPTAPELEEVVEWLGKSGIVTVLDNGALAYSG